MKIGSYWILKPFEAFGNRAEELYYALLKCRRDGLRLVIIKRKWDLWGRVSFRRANRALLEIRHPLLTRSIAIEIFNYLFSFAISVLRVIGTGARKAASVFGISGVGYGLVGLSEKSFGCAGLWGNVKAPFKADRLAIDWPAEWQRKLNIEYGSRDELDNRIRCLRGKSYVCLHVRTGGYSNDFAYSAHRNASIEFYRPAICELIDRGFIVVRLGDPTMPQLQLDGVFDYAHSTERSESNDLLLIQHCDFYIGSLTGPIDVACMFEKRILTVNCLSLSHCTWYRPESRFIPKKASVNGRILKLKEQIELEYFEIYGTGRMIKGLEYLENSPGEILAALLEFLEPSELSDSQLSFNDFLGSKLTAYFERVRLWESPDEDALQKSRWLGRLLSAQGSICAKYVEENWQ